jgi:parallel beta-helix repeat protein
MNNEIVSNDYGIILDDSYNNIVSFNVFQDNNRFGIWIDGNSGENSVLFNDFIGNNPGDSQALDDGPSNLFRSNYWDDWTSPDLNHDGVVDNPYPIDGSANNQDSRPRATREPFTAPTTTTTTTTTTTKGGAGFTGVILLLSILSLLIYNRRKFSSK